jgi:hypothetical protein
VDDVADVLGEERCDEDEVDGVDGAISWWSGGTNDAVESEMTRHVKRVPHYQWFVLLPYPIC